MSGGFVTSSGTGEGHVKGTVFQPWGKWMRWNSPGDAERVLKQRGVTARGYRGGVFTR